MVQERRSCRDQGYEKTIAPGTALLPAQSCRGRTSAIEALLQRLIYL